MGQPPDNLGRSRVHKRHQVVTARVFVWPDLRPLPDRADAIIELAGPGDQSRDQVAVELARQNRAPVLVQSTIPATTRVCPRCRA